MPRLRAALAWGKRPTAMLMDDEHFGNRNPFTGEPVREGWIRWDFVLAHAFQVIEMFTRDTGMFQWQVEDPEERIEVEQRIDPFRAALDRKTSVKDYKATPGEYFAPILESSREGGELWTYAEWRESKIKALLEHDKLE